MLYVGLFNKQKVVDPKEQVKEWSKKIRKEGFGLERQINAIKREEAKVTRTIKDAARRGDQQSCQVLAKEIVESRKAIKRLHMAKVNLASVDMEIKMQASQLKVAGNLQKSAEVMKAMQQLIKMPEIRKVMKEMSKEMIKAGVIGEMIEDSMETLQTPEELEEDTQKEVDKIISAITSNKLRLSAAAAGSSVEQSIDLPEPPETKEIIEEEKKEEEKGGLQEMQQRFQALRS